MYQEETDDETMEPNEKMVGKLWADKQAIKAQLVLMDIMSSEAGRAG